jgi:hypothetical protein
MAIVRGFAGVMSEVISFRFDLANPREAKALEVLNAWIEKGYSTRHIITTALLELDRSGSDLELSQGDRDWGSVLDKISKLLEFVDAMKIKPIERQEFNPEQSNLNENFLASIKQGVKPGLKPP